MKLLGLIPSKYFEKSTERLVSANGSQMKIKYELNNAHVCHDNVCFKISSVLVKNLTDKVILGTNLLIILLIPLILKLAVEIPAVMLLILSPKVKKMKN